MEKNNNQKVNENIKQNDVKQIENLQKTKKGKSLKERIELANKNIKTEKQKKEEMLQNSDILQKNQKTHRTQNIKKNILVAFLVLVLSFISIVSIVVSGNMSTSTTISANVANTRIAQAKLAELGYFNGEIDGVFDQETVSAIKNYQKDNNIAETGNLDSTTAAAIGVTDNTQANTDLYLLAKLIHSEARGEPYEGQVAVGAVVLNRVDDAGFPNTLQGVIYQPWAFTALHDGQFDLEPNSTAYQAAQDALNGWDPTYGCIYYYNPVTATSSWIFSRQIIVTIGRHVFCI